MGYIIKFPLKVTGFYESRPAERSLAKSPEANYMFRELIL